MTTIPDKVVKYFALRTATPLSEATSIFSKLDAFLTNASEAKQVPSMEIDEAWHTFILHTREYAEYCISRFGRFIHHVPNDPALLPNNSQSCTSCSSSCSMGFDQKSKSLRS